MSGKRYLVLGVAAVVALAAVVPALAGDGPTAGSSLGPRGIAKRALKRAKIAQATATAAKNSAAQALGRTKRLEFLATNPTAEDVVLTAAGLRIHAQCVTPNFLTVRADTTVNDSIIHITTVKTGNTVTDFQDDSFDVGEDAPLNAGGSDDDNIQGTLTYRNGATGQVVTMTYLLEESYLGANDCAALGTATIA